MEYDSFSPDYFSLDDILASQERVPVTVKVDLPKLGFLDTSRPGEISLKTGTSLELPYWMVWSLRTRGRVDVELPKNWQPAQRQIVHADPNVVDLYKMGPHYYEFGSHMARLLNGSGKSEESDEISSLLLNTFMRRFRNIMDASCNSDARDTLSNTETLDELERSLYHKVKLTSVSSLTVSPATGMVQDAGNCPIYEFLRVKFHSNIRICGTVEGPTQSPLQRWFSNIVKGRQMSWSDHRFRKNSLAV